MQQSAVKRAATAFGASLGYGMRRDDATKTVSIAFEEPGPPVPVECRVVVEIAKSATADGTSLPIDAGWVLAPAGSRLVKLSYA
jgi:hypothetical protein